MASIFDGNIGQLTGQTGASSLAELLGLPTDQAVAAFQLAGSQPAFPALFPALPPLNAPGQASASGVPLEALQQALQATQAGGLLRSAGLAQAAPQAAPQGFSFSQHPAINSMIDRTFPGLLGGFQRIAEG